VPRTDTQRFVDQGIATTTLDDLTRGAGMSKGLFYQYFRSKDDLVVALQDQFSRELADLLRAAAAGQDDWGAKLDACAQVSFDWYRDRHRLHEVLFRHAGHEGAAGANSSTRASRPGRSQWRTPRRRPGCSTW
jgi:AcrR family transcriptional regulator